MPLDEEDCAVGDIVNDAAVRGELAASPEVCLVMAQSDLRSDLDAAVDKVLEFYEYGKERLGDDFFCWCSITGASKSRHGSLWPTVGRIYVSMCAISVSLTPPLLRNRFSQIVVWRRKAWNL